MAPIFITCLCVSVDEDEKVNNDRYKRKENKIEKQIKRQNIVMSGSEEIRKTRFDDHTLIKVVAVSAAAFKPFIIYVCTGRTFSNSSYCYHRHCQATSPALLVPFPLSTTTCGQMSLRG